MMVVDMDRDTLVFEKPRQFTDPFSSLRVNEDEGIDGAVIDLFWFCDIEEIGGRSLFS
jgi:hypothetical protein